MLRKKDREAKWCMREDKDEGKRTKDEGFDVGCFTSPLAPLRPRTNACPERGMYLYVFLRLKHEQKNKQHTVPLSRKGVRGGWERG